MAWGEKGENDIATLISKTKRSQKINKSRHDRNDIN